MLRGFQRVHHSFRVISFQPAVRCHRPIARSVRARVHHRHAIARLQQQLCLSQCTHAIVGDTMKNEHPISVGLRGTNLPAAQESTIEGAHIEILAMRADLCKCGISFLNEIGREFPAHRMQERRARQPAHDRGHQRRRKRQD